MLALMTHVRGYSRQDAKLPMTVLTRGPILLVVFPIRIGLLAGQIPVLVGSWRCSKRR